MTAVLILAVVWTGSALAVVVVILLADRTSVDASPPVPHCPACAVADDPTLTSLDLMWWAMECEATP